MMVVQGTRSRLGPEVDEHAGRSWSGQQLHGRHQLRLVLHAGKLWLQLFRWCYKYDAITIRGHYRWLRLTQLHTRRLWYAA